MDWLYVILLAIGCFYLFTATIGLFMLPDVFTRLHATTKCDTMGAGCILAAVAVKSGNWFVAGKLALIFVFILLVSPTASHMIAWVAKEQLPKKASEKEAG
ncbi:MAG: monovalent cation/H(+) antiporter subunit G [Firmicutes bacterium]|nr:monovalent cation/H(+) antiporter subunit G [Bacillota bacterium]